MNRRANTTRQEPAAIFLFDGVCNLCNGAVKFVIPRDPTGRVHFASLQSPEGQRLLQQHGLPADHLDSMVLLEGSKVYVRSAAVLRLTRHLNRLWPLAYGFVVIPAPLRDAVYKLVARNRYRWFGQRDACMIPTPELKARFLS